MKIIAALAILLLSASPAFAEVEYYIELGNEQTEAGAHAEWQTLAEKHKDLLADLKFSPRTVLQMDNTVKTRLEAGPLTNKKYAEKICKKLFAGGTPCFILEGEKQPPKPLAEAVSDVLPWLAPPPVSLPGAGEVEVAEAIPVPLTNKTTPETSLSPTFMTIAESGWLNVYAFNDENSAGDFWELVRGAAPEKTAGLRVRTVHPLSQQQVSLNIGPFPSRADAEAFCVNGIQSVNAVLSCRFTKNEPSGSVEKVMPRYEHGERYRMRRENLGGNNRPLPSPSLLTDKAYWVQVATAPDQMAAMERWQAMRKDNLDLLQGLRTRIGSTLMGGAEYTVSVGPLPRQEDAISLCNALAARSIQCLVYAPR